MWAAERTRNEPALGWSVSETQKLLRLERVHNAIREEFCASVSIPGYNERFGWRFQSSLTGYESITDQIPNWNHSFKAWSCIKEWWNSKLS